MLEARTLLSSRQESHSDRPLTCCIERRFDRRRFDDRLLCVIAPHLLHQPPWEEWELGNLCPTHVITNRCVSVFDRKQSALKRHLIGNTNLTICHLNAPVVAKVDAVQQASWAPGGDLSSHVL